MRGSGDPILSQTGISTHPLCPQQGLGAKLGDIQHAASQTLFHPGLDSSAPPLPQLTLAYQQISLHNRSSELVLKGWAW